MSEKQEENEEMQRQGFFKKVWTSITKIEKYPDMASQGLGKAFIYLCKIIAILAIVLCLGMMFQTYQILQEGIQYLQNEFPEFSYKDGILKVSSEQMLMISEKDSYVGKTIIDTNTQEEQTKNQYLNETEFNKQSMINYVNGSQIIGVYISVFITIFIYSFMIYLITTLSNVVFLSIFGYLTTWMARIKMRFLAVFNMSVYALTLSIFLNILYILVNIFVDFNMEYFQVMYVSVAAIYLVAAIFLLKTEFIKQQMELMKIVEVQEMVRKEMEEKEQAEKQEQEKKDTEKKDKEQEKEDENKDVGSNGEPQGSNA